MLGVGLSEGRAAGHAAQDPAAVVGGHDDAAVLYTVAVVGFTAAHRRQREAVTEFQSFDGRDGEDRLREPVFQTAEGVVAQTGRQPGDRAFDHAAQGIAPGLRVLQQAGHGFRILRRNSSDGYDPGRHFDPFPCQQLLRDAAGHAEWCGHTAGIMAAAGRDASGLHIGRPVRVSGPGDRAQSLVVRGPRVGIAEDRAHRAAGEDAVFQAGLKFRYIRFAPRGGEFAVPRRPPVQKRLQRRPVQRRARGDAFYSHADKGLVRAPENRKTIKCSE